MGRVGCWEAIKCIVGVGVEQDKQGTGGSKHQGWESLAGEAAQELRGGTVAVIEEDIVVGTLGGKAGELERDVSEVRLWNYDDGFDVLLLVLTLWLY